MFAVVLATCLALPGVESWAAVLSAQPQAQKQAPEAPKGESRKDGPTGDGKAETKNAEEKQVKVSEADQLIRLQEHLATDTKELAKIKKTLDDPHGEYHRAEASFKDLETDLQRKSEELKKTKVGAVEAKLDADIASLKKQRDLARDRFNIAIKERKNLQDQSALLEVRLLKTRKAIALLEGPGPQNPNVNTAGPPGKASQPAAQPAPAPAPAPTTDLELAKARQEVQARDAEARTAQEKVKSIDDRIMYLSKSVELNRRIVETLQDRATIAAQTQSALQHELITKRAAKVPETDLAPLLAKIAEAGKLLDSTRKDIATTTDQLHILTTDVKKLQADKVLAQEQAAEREKAAQAAESRAKYLASPLAPHNLLLWIWQHVPMTVVVIVAMVLLLWFIRMTSRRIVKWMVQHQFRGAEKDRENRADTLVGVFRNTASFLVYAGGSLTILQGLGIPILPLLGGAAAGGLAVAFGAQSIIKDYLSGFVLLMEDQYGINDVVKIAGIGGQVENITLRRTVLRDNEGTVHFIPHGTLTTVSNMTHRWARAFFEIRIAYKEDVDQVMHVLLELCQELRADPVFGRSILDEPEMLGVDQLNENGITLQFQIRTSPLQQWAVKRELLRRIKRRFDELGIELPHYQYVYLPRSALPGNGVLEAANPLNGKNKPS